MMLLLMMLTAVAAPANANPMAVDDWQTMTILQVAGADAPNGTHHVRVQAGDLDGDGVADEAILALDCADGALVGSSYIVAPRDSSTGMASGKRMHKPYTITKEWGAASPLLREMRPSYDVKKVEGSGARTATYDVKTMKGNEKKVPVKGWNPETKEAVAGKTEAHDDWQPIALSNADGLCPAVAADALRATKTRSNIQNN